MLTNFFRSLAITICSVLYPLIPKLYGLFYDLASTRLLTTEEVQSFSQNIYVLVSVIMLFAFAVKAIESIINPDLLFDSKKGFTSVIKRSVISMCLIVAIPFLFNYFYKFQTQVLDNNLIEKVLVGVQINQGENLAEKSGGGQILAGTAISAVLYPSSDNIETSSETLANNYSKMVEKDISKIKQVGKSINEKTDGSEDDEEYVLEFEWLIAIVSGGLIVYFLVLFCIDTAVRLIKMTFLELISPMIVIAYIYAGDDILKKWFKEVGSTAVSIFIRIAALALMIYIMSILPSFIDDNFKNSWDWLAKLLIIMGLLMFVNESTKLIERIFGVSISQKGGIAGRLGSMAAVGGLAQRAWGAVRGAGGAALALGGGALGAAALGAGKAAVGGAKSIPNMIESLRNGTAKEDLKRKLRNAQTSLEKGVRNAPSAIKSGLGRAGSTIGAGMKAGSYGKGIVSGAKAFSSSSQAQLSKISAAEIKEQQATDKLYSKMGIDPENHEIQNLADTQSRFDRSLSNSTLNGNTKENIRKLNVANKNKMTAEKMKTSADKISEKLLDARDNTKSIQLKQKLENLEDDFSSGNITHREFANRLNQMVSNGEISTSAARSISGNLDNILNIASSTGLGDKLIENGKISVKGIKQNLSAAEQQVEYAKKMYDASYNQSSDKEKSVIDRYMEASNIINKKNASMASKGSSGYKNQYVGPSNDYTQTPSPDTNRQNLNSNQNSSSTNRQNLNSNQNSHSSTNRPNESLIQNANNSYSQGGYNNVNQRSSQDLPTWAQDSNLTQTDSGIYIPRSNSNTQTSNTDSSTPPRIEPIEQPQRKASNVSLQERLTRISDRIKELQDKDFLTADERNELEELKREYSDVYSRIIDSNLND